MAQNHEHLSEWQALETGGGRVTGNEVRRFILPPSPTGYADAQIDDYGRQTAGSAPHFRHQPELALRLRARFSHDANALLGTAGFGFWNAPYGDPRTRRLALPAATWFFFASPPNNLPFGPEPDGRGWFAATLDATTPRALALAPFAPAVLALNQVTALRQRVWPAVRRGLSISAARLSADLREWHEYRLEWRAGGCRFLVDGDVALETAHSPRGPLGFVCWLDNQYLVATARGRFRAGTLSLAAEQWMEVVGLAIEQLD